MSWGEDMTYHVWACTSGMNNEMNEYLRKSIFILSFQSVLGLVVGYQEMGVSVAGKQGRHPSAIIVDQEHYTVG